MRHGPITIFPLGGFGQAVARWMGAMMPGVFVSEPGADPAPDVDDASAMVVASWRAAPATFDALDEKSHRTMTPLLPVLADGTIVRVGPLVVPGRGACWRCFSLRLAQHAPSASDPRLALENFYHGGSGDIGPRGYFDAFAAVSAARATQVLTGIESGTAAPGEIWQMDMLSRRVMVSVATGIHGCSRCGLGRPEPERSYAAMRAELADLGPTPGSAAGWGR